MYKNCKYNIQGKFLCIKNIELYQDKKCFNFEYEILGNKLGKTVLLLGTTHGNEFSGHFILKDLIKKLKKKEITTNLRLIIIPTVNVCGFNNNNRYIPVENNKDINRNYPGIKNKKPIGIHNEKIIEIINKYEPILIIDFHEGYDYHIRNKNSIGSTLSINNKKIVDISKNIIKKINETIYYEKKKWILRKNYNFDNLIDGTLQMYVKLYKKNINYILVEITGQNSNNSMYNKLLQGKIIVEEIVKNF